MATQLPEIDFEIQSGRATGGRMFIRVIHIPTGMSRTVVGLNGPSHSEVVRQLREELTAVVLGSETPPA